MARLNPRQQRSGAAYGEIRAGVDSVLAFDLPFGPVAYQLLRAARPGEEAISYLTGLEL